ncbi:TM2 domain-containing protein [Moritella sp. Urea-trap-13]|uniref:TM2 domain-containing protein n=1 Tax=Moritella sp. Urea-trap-13 TaxID=2058327 RepID=UPI0018E3CF32|nr:TM2 domain-containing protein [Moritella sp. Urea-trap-13]
MKGSILEFNIGSKKGIISNEDGCRYTFTMDQWRDKSSPRVGSKVKCTLESGQLAKIRMTTLGKSKKIWAVLLSFFFGAVGAHKFYLGYNKQGLCMLLLFVFGYVLLGLPSMVIAVIAMVEFLIYVCKSDVEFERDYVLENRPWF